MSGHILGSSEIRVIVPEELLSEWGTWWTCEDVVHARYTIAIQRFHHRAECHSVDKAIRD